MLKGKFATIIKTLAASYLITAVMLLILTVLMYKFQINSSVIYIGIIATYIISNLAGGIIIGKVTGDKKFIWGLIMGAAYFLILSIISIVINKSLYESGVTEVFTAFACCSLGGMFGGMIS